MGARRRIFLQLFFSTIKGKYPRVSLTRTLSRLSFFCVHA
jgi:hypothetical protein